MSWRDWFRRRTARVVLVDADGRVLLFRAAARGRRGGPACWYLPGGGILPREPVEQAAARELREETGIAPDVLGPVLATRRDVEVRIRGRRAVQDESYVAARIAVVPAARGRGDDDRAPGADHRWWPLDELRATSDTLTPPDLVALVETVIERATLPVHG